jgi:hypothetical protein
MEMVLSEYYQCRPERDLRYTVLEASYDPLIAGDGYGDGVHGGISGEGGMEEVDD